MGRSLRKGLYLILRYRKTVIVGLQLGLIALAALLAILVRYPLDVLPPFSEQLLFISIAVAIKLPICLMLGLSSGWWQYTSLSDLLQLSRAVLVSSIAFSSVALLFLDPYRPRLLLLDAFMTLLLLGGVRVIVRLIRERKDSERRAKRASDRRAVIVGAGSAGLGLLRHLQSNPLPSTHIVGLIDDDRHKRKMSFYGVPVLGTTHELHLLASRYSVNEVLIAIPTISKTEKRRILDTCKNLNITSKTVPALNDILAGRASTFEIRNLNVEDLLGREPIRLNRIHVGTALKNKVVLVTGAGGSIGSELCRQILNFEPRTLILFERSENALFHIQRELNRTVPKGSTVFQIGDILDEELMEQVFSQFQPEVVFHAAAYKHVSLMEDNPREAVRNNVLGTLALVKKARKYGVRKLINISTDKAVNPLSVMGFTKRMAEIIVQNHSRPGSDFLSVRFGNVLGSSGSVVEIFRQQIAEGGPLTVTHEDATRFFMTAPEAVELVLHAGVHGVGGEIYMLDMGKPERIMDLAERMIQLADPEGRRDLRIEIVGLKRGEKLSEELVWHGEDFGTSDVEKVYRLLNKVDSSSLQRDLDRLETLIEVGAVDVAEQLRAIVQRIDSNVVRAQDSRRNSDLNSETASAMMN